MNHIITKWRPFEGCDRLPGIMMECTDPGAVLYDLSRPWVAPEDNMIYATDGRILVRMRQRIGDEQFLPWRTHEQVKAEGEGKRVRGVDQAFEIGLPTALGPCELPVVSNPCREPGSCPKNGVECDCPSCEGCFWHDEPEGGVPVGDLGHKMAQRYIYLLQYFGVREVRLPSDRDHPFRFSLGCVEGVAMGMRDPKRR